jgi:hypothetical protein
MNVCAIVMLAFCLVSSGRARAEGPRPQPGGPEPGAAQPWPEHDSAGSETAPDAKQAEYKRKLSELQATLKPERGEVSIGDGLAMLHITPEFAFLESKDAEKV